MNSTLQIPLNATPEQETRLAELQRVFAEACNLLTPVVRDTRCWNRVALHHMTYRTLRARFPQLGSQMACNAIYSVSRTSRLVYQSPSSPFNLSRLGDRPLPLIRLLPDSPVYFDRHTLSLKDGHLSMFTLDGRMRFGVDLPEAAVRRFKEAKLHEIVLASHRPAPGFSLTFVFGAGSRKDAPAPSVEGPAPARELPEYVLVFPEAQTVPTGDPA